jgi:fatty acid desaturase
MESAGIAPSGLSVPADTLGHEAKSPSAMQALPIRPTFGRALAALSHAPLMTGALAAWWVVWWPLTAITWCSIGWMDHAALTRLHKAAYGMLCRWRWLNELQGVVPGTVSLTPLTMRRYVHARHHVHLGGERDPAFWQYNLPWTP